MKIFVPLFLEMKDANLNLVGLMSHKYKSKSLSRSKTLQLLINHFLKTSKKKMVAKDVITA